MQNKDDTSLQLIQSKIYIINGYSVMLDRDLAALYGVETRVLKQAVRRNRERFPEDFMFELSKEDIENLRSQSVISSQHGGTRYPPFAFTEQGVAMLSSVLNSGKAIEVNISIMRAFVLIRRHFNDYANLKEQIIKLEKEMNLRFKDIHQALKYLLEKEKNKIDQKNRKPIGYKKPE